MAISLESFLPTKPVFHKSFRDIHMEGSLRRVRTYTCLETHSDICVKYKNARSNVTILTYTQCGDTGNVITDDTYTSASGPVDIIPRLDGLSIKCRLVTFVVQACWRNVARDAF